MLQYYYCLQSFRSLCALLTDSDGTIYVGSLSESFQRHLKEYICIAPVMITDDNVGCLFELLMQLTEDIEMSTGTSVGDDTIQQQLAAVQELEYRQMKRFLALPSSDSFLEETSISPLFTSNAYRHLGRLISRNSTNPPLGCRDLVSLLMVSETITTAVISFDAMFGDIVKNSLLEVAMADRLHAEFTAECVHTGATIDEQMCRVFTVVLAKWRGSFDEMGLGERIYVVGLWMKQLLIFWIFHPMPVLVLVEIFPCP